MPSSGFPYECREITKIEICDVGRVVPCGSGVPPYVVVDQDGVVVAEAAAFLRHVAAGDFSGSSVRSYALALLRWFRFLHAVDVVWDCAGSSEVRDFVLWMRATRPRRRRRSPGAPVPGGVNLRTGKRYLGGRYAPATINHNLAVLSAFYDFHLAQGGGPLRNPVPSRSGPGGARADAHHNPLEPFRPGRRAAYRQRVPEREPRAIPDGLFDELFTAMPSDRDRAILALYVSTGARPSELLGIRGAHIDYGEQLVAVIRKGTRALQWLPGSPDAFVWLRIYQHGLAGGLTGPDQPVWWTRRRPWRPLDYEAMRAVLRRANRSLGTNWTLHDLRHTCAVRMASDPKMPLVTVQMLLGHAHLSTTERYLRPHLEQVVAHVREHHRRRAESAGAAGTADPPPDLRYDAADLQELFGWQQVPGEPR